MESKQVLYIYQITNLINGKIYVGAHATNNVEDGYMGSGSYLLRAYKKYGKENFKKNILMYCSCEKDLFEKEAEIVTTNFVNRQDTYNLVAGGRGGRSPGKIGGITSFINNKGFHSMSADQKLQQSIKANLINKQKEKGYYFNSSLREKSRLSTLTPEARQKRLDTLKKIKHAQGSKNSQFGKIWITNGIINQKIKKEDEIPEGFWKGRIKGTVKLAL